MMITNLMRAIAQPPIPPLTHPPTHLAAQLPWFPRPSQDTVTEWLEAIATPIQTWLNQHPPIALAVHHPLISLGLFAIALLLIWSLFQAFIEILQELWMHVLKVPLHLGRWILRGIVRATLYPLIKAGHRISGIDRSQTPAIPPPPPQPSPISTDSSPSVTLPHTHGVHQNGLHSYSLHENYSRESHLHGQSTVPPLTEPAPPEPALLGENHSPTADIFADTFNETQTIVQLLRRLEQLTHEQNQILHRIALLAETQNRSPTP